VTAAESVTPRIVAALDRTWAAIRARHPEVPEVVITLGAGTGGTAPGTLLLGHFAGDRWQHAAGGRLPEMFIAGEGLARGAREVLDTELHEAAHGLAAARDIRDTSRQGRYHNARYRGLAEELRLAVEHAGPGFGWAATTVPDATAAVYAAEVEDLAAALVAWRRPEGRRGGRAGSNNGVAARCGCGRRIRIAESVLAAGPVTCGLCGGDFRAAS